MTDDEMIAKAAEALDHAHKLSVQAAVTAEVDPDKTDTKIQRLGYVASEWMKLAAVTHELAGPPAEP
ncbi:MAG: hypothetical protein V4472_24995 [Pseudomonadota bacterium]